MVVTRGSPTTIGPCFADALGGWLEKGLQGPRSVPAKGRGGAARVTEVVLRGRGRDCGSVTATKRARREHGLRLAGR